MKNGHAVSGPITEMVMFGKTHIHKVEAQHCTVIKGEFRVPVSGFSSGLYLCDLKQVN